MRTQLEQEDLQTIVSAVIEGIRPLLVSKQSTRSLDQMFDIAGLSKYLSVSKSWIYQRTRLNEIPFVRIKGQILFRKSRIDEWLEHNETPAVEKGRTG